MVENQLEDGGGESGRRREFLCGGERVLERGLRACERMQPFILTRGASSWDEFRAALVSSVVDLP